MAILISTHRTFATAFTAALLAVTACSKKNQPEPTVSASWVIDGKERTAINVLAEDNGFGGIDLHIYQRISTPSVRGSMVTVTLYLPKKVGTYTIGSSPDVRGHFIDLDANDGPSKGSYTADAGSITISTLTATTMSGTFTLSGKGFNNDKLRCSITNGKFQAAVYKM